VSQAIVAPSSATKKSADALMSTSHLAGETKTSTAARIKWWPEDAGLVVVFALMILAIGVPYPEFLSFGSIKTVLRQSALISIIAFGMVFLVAMVEIDLSVGGIFATASSLAALLIKFHHVDPWIAVAIALAAGALLGGLNGILASVLKVPLIIVSLGTLSAYFGLHLILSDGKAVFGFLSLPGLAAICLIFRSRSGPRPDAPSLCILFLFTRDSVPPYERLDPIRWPPNSSASKQVIFVSTQLRWWAF
jgi:ribose/xylose/arabinose/galactoside ABC-type transport system permease subunit